MPAIVIVGSIVCFSGIVLIVLQGFGLIKGLNPPKGKMRGGRAQMGPFKLDVKTTMPGLLVLALGVVLLVVSAITGR